MWLRSDFGSAVTFDNLTVTFSTAAIPETSTVVVGILSAILLGGHLWYRRRRTA
jgi:hypothetical protein